MTRRLFEEESEQRFHLLQNMCTLMGAEKETSKRKPKNGMGHELQSINRFFNSAHALLEIFKNEDLYHLFGTTAWCIHAFVIAYVYLMCMCKLLLHSYPVLFKLFLKNSTINIESC